MKSIFIKVVFTLLSTVIICQYASAQKEIYNDATVLFNKYEYPEAIQLYKKVIAKKGKHANKATVKIADAYRLTGNNNKAQYWYKRSVALGESPSIHRFYYAQSLLNNGEYDEAKKWFDQYAYLEPGDARGKRFSESIGKQGELKADSANYTISSMVFNTPGSAFGPSFFKNGIVFTAEPSRGQTNNWTGSNYLDLYYTEPGSDDAWTTPSRIKGDLKSKFHEGPASFTNDNQLVYFTRSSTRKGNNNVTNLEVLEANANTFEITNEMPFNNKAFTVAHPYVSADGSTIYFSSDMPGGYGGTDLYKSTKVGGSWGEPENLGGSINTAGEDMFAFIHPDGTLYFASNGHGGFGGLDVYMSRFDGEAMTEAENLGYPINTKHDDFTFILSDDYRYGFFASNRKGPKGNDDIYMVNLNNAAQAKFKPDMPIAVVEAEEKEEEPIVIEKTPEPTVTFNAEPEKIEEPITPIIEEDIAVIEKIAKPLYPEPVEIEIAELANPNVFLQESGEDLVNPLKPIESAPIEIVEKELPEPPTKPNVFVQDKGEVKENSLMLIEPTVNEPVETEFTKPANSNVFVQEKGDDLVNPLKPIEQEKFTEPEEVIVETVENYVAPQAIDDDKSSPRLIVQGLVSNAAGTSIPYATVKLKEKATNIAIETKSDNNGRFNFEIKTNKAYIIETQANAHETSILPLDLNKNNPLVDNGLRVILKTGISSIDNSQAALEPVVPKPIAATIENIVPTETIITKPIVPAIAENAMPSETIKPEVTINNIGEPNIAVPVETNVIQKVVPAETAVAKAIVPVITNNALPNETMEPTVIINKIGAPNVTIPTKTIAPTTNLTVEDVIETKENEIITTNPLTEKGIEKPVVVKTVVEPKTISVAPVIEEEEVVVSNSGFDQVLNMDHIYYDYGSARLRVTSMQTLKKLYVLMQGYPNSKLIFNSHADSRGADKDNMYLSSIRNRACSDYLVSMGINPSRIIEENNGENKLIENCPPGSKCNEFQHQMNRRTEIRLVDGSKVIAFSGANLEASEQMSVMQPMQTTTQAPVMITQQPIITRTSIPASTNAYALPQSNHPENFSRYTPNQGLVFSVQLGAFVKPIKKQNKYIKSPPENIQFDDFTLNGMHRYVSGSFSNEQEAAFHKNELRNYYSDAYVVAYNNGQRIQIYEARKILRGRR